MDCARGQEKAANQLRIGHGINLAFFERQTKFAGPIYLPSNILVRINPVIAQCPLSENERRRSHARNANSFALQIRDRVNLRVIRSLHAKTSAMNPAGKLHVKSLLDWLQEIHHQVLGNVVAAECEGILVVLPGTLDQLRFESFIPEEAFLVGGED